MRWTIPILLVSVLAATAPARAADGGDPLSPIDSGTVTVTARATTPTRPDIYGTVALNAGVTAYGARWRRVSAADEYDPRIRALGAAVSAAHYDPVDRLADLSQPDLRALLDRRDVTDAQWRSILGLDDDLPDVIHILD